MTKMVLSEATLSGVSHQAKGGAMRTQFKVVAVLSAAEQKRLHISMNGFKGVELDQEFDGVELRLIPPEALKAHMLSILADRAAKFKVKEHEAKEGKPDRQVLEFTAYATGSQLEAIGFMEKMGAQVCRLELAERQQQLFEQAEEKPVKRGRGRPKKLAVVRDGKAAAAGKDDD